MTTPLHLLAYALHPKYYHSKILSLPGRTAPNKDSEVVQGYKTALRKIYRDVGIAMEVHAEFGAFVQSTGNFSDPLAMDDRGHMDPITWWGYHGGDNIHLSTLATRLLSQVASSSSAERNWSTYGFIHSVKRNRLGSKKAEELVYVHSKLRLLSHKKDEYKLGPTKQWDVEPELPDLDMTLTSISNMNLFDEEAPTIATSSGHGSNVPLPTVDVDSHSMDEDIFDDM